MINSSQIDPVNLIRAKHSAPDLLRHAEIKNFSSNFNEILKRHLVDLKNDESLLSSLSRENLKGMIYDENRNIYDREENYYYNDNISHGALANDESNKLTSEKPENNIFEKNTIEEGEAALNKANTVEGVRYRESSVEDSEGPSGDQELGREDNKVARSTEDTASSEDLREILLKALSNIKLLNALLGDYEKNSEIRDIQLSLKKLQESISLDKSSGKNVNALLETILSRLRLLLKKIEEIPYLQKNSKLLATISNLKRELLNASKVLSEYYGKTERGNGTGRAGFEVSDINNRIRDEILFTVDSSGDKKQDNTASGNDNSKLGFQFFKNSTPSYRNVNSNVSGNVHTRNAFNEQLQSIIQNARIFVRDSRNGSFSIRLYPESLGKVNINLGLEQGVLHGRFLVDSMDSKNLLLENISTIKEQLQDAGISVGEFQVNVRDDGERLLKHAEENMFGHSYQDAANSSNEYDTISTYLHDGTIDMII
jgi:flagellar hook-length control protein FliK